jgi:signal transduction histidine kinase
VLDRLKDDFVATVNHELRTPLTSIRTFSEILRDRPDLPPERREEFLRVVVGETERLTRLINQLLGCRGSRAPANPRCIRTISSPSPRIPPQRCGRCLPRTA